MIQTLQKQKKYITFVDEAGEQWELDARILPFSQFLVHMNLEEEESNILTLELPSFLRADSLIMALVAKFYELHDYDKQSMKVSKVKMHSKERPYDLITQQFIQQHVQNQPEQFVKRAMNISEYLKLNQLKQALCTYVATLNYQDHNESQMQRIIESSNIFYSRQMEINLKNGMMNYSKQFGKDLLKDYRAKIEKRRGINPNNNNQQ